MIRLRIEKILQEKQLTKSAFAELLGVQKQNVNSILETKNLDKLQQIADVLDVELQDLILVKENERPSINGYIEYNSQVYSIKNFEDFNNLAKILTTNKNSEIIP